MKIFFVKVLAVIGSALIAFALLGAFKSTASVQRGYNGVGMEVNAFHTDLEKQVKDNAVPPSLPPAAQNGALSVDAYQNVQVLGHLTTGEFTRQMVNISSWVAGRQGCAYCHVTQKDAAGNVVKDEDGYPVADQNNLQSDDVYAKRVARRMLQMTMHINSDWKQHVVQTGVTCYTCHRGQPIPKNIWYDEAVNPNSLGLLGNSAGQNRPAAVAGLTSLPSDVLRPYLVDEENIRVISTAALPDGNRSSIKQTEWTYGLMMHMSSSLGVNCTFCHNTRSMAQWETSPPQRTSAWYGIRMARDLNKNYLEPLRDTYPAERLGPTGDAPKLNCATCHGGAYKPLLGVSMLKDNMVLASAQPQPQKSAPPPAPADAAGAPGAAPAPGAATPPAAAPAAPATGTKPPPKP